MKFLSFLPFGPRKRNLMADLTTTKLLCLLSALSVIYIFFGRVVTRLFNLEGGDVGRAAIEKHLPNLTKTHTLSAMQAVQPDSPNYYGYSQEEAGQMPLNSSTGYNIPGQMNNSYGQMNTIQRQGNNSYGMNSSQRQVNSSHVKEEGINDGQGARMSSLLARMPNGANSYQPQGRFFENNPNANLRLCEDPNTGLEYFDARPLPDPDTIAERRLERREIWKMEQEKARELQKEKEMRDSRLRNEEKKRKAGYPAFDHLRRRKEGGSIMQSSDENNLGCCRDKPCRHAHYKGHQEPYLFVRGTKQMRRVKGASMQKLEENERRRALAQARRKEPYRES